VYRVHDCLTQQKPSSPVQDWNSGLKVCFFLLPAAENCDLSEVDSTPLGKWLQERMIWRRCHVLLVTVMKTEDCLVVALEVI